jgi:hypothetical protein
MRLAYVAPPAAPDAFGLKPLVQPGRQRRGIVEVQHLQHFEQPVQGVKVTPVLAHPGRL